MPTIQHKIIPDSRNHPWKGEDIVQVDRAIYHSDGGGSGVWASFVNGQITFTGNESIATPVAYTQVAPTFTGLGGSVGVTEDDHSLIYSVFKDVTLAIDWSITLSHNDAAPQDVYAVHNQGAQEEYEQRLTLAQNEKATMGGRHIFFAGGGEDVSLYVKVASGNVSVTQAVIAMYRVF